MASALRESVELEMRLRGFSPRTHESYIHALKELARFYWRPLETLLCDEVQAFLDHLITVRKLAWSTINVYFSAYRFLYEQVLKRSAKEFSIPPRGRSGTRPGILSPEEVERLVRAPANLKHRALLAMTFGSGLRVSEVVRVQPRHIDRGRMMLFVTGKGHKDRYTILSARALTLLGEHWRANGPFEYFFHGRDKSRPMSVGTAQAIYYQALERSGVRRVGGIHVLRHCFATFLMEAGKDIYTIKRWMGHTALVTTGRYMHVRAERLRMVKSPLDTLCDEV
jgi:integrase/recombinase XerD